MIQLLYSCFLLTQYIPSMMVWRVRTDVVFRISLDYVDLVSRSRQHEAWKIVQPNTEGPI